MIGERSVLIVWRRTSDTKNAKTELREGDCGYLPNLLSALVRLPRCGMQSTHEALRCQEGANVDHAGCDLSGNTHPALGMIIGHLGLRRHRSWRRRYMLDASEGRQFSVRHDWIGC
jgi:hypothetical protein